METRAGYVAVGSFVLALLFALVLFTLWLGGPGTGPRPDRYLVYFTGSVTGLQQGSPVRYRGIPVGQVAELSIDPRNIERVRTLIEVTPGTPILQGSEATLELAGITGGLYVQITGGGQGQPPLEAPVDEAYPVIPSKPSSLTELVETVPGLIDQATRLFAQAGGFLSDENRAALAAALVSIDQAAATIASASSRIDDTLERTGALVTNLDGMVEELRVDTARISDRLDTAISGFDAQVAAVGEAATQLAASLSSAGNQVAALMRETRPGLEDFSQTGLYEFTLMVSELRGLAQNLSRLVARLEQSPAQFLLGTGNRGVPPER